MRSPSTVSAGSTRPGVEKSEAEAVAWYRRAAEQGLAGAQFSLGSMYDRGIGVTADHLEAAKWIRLAAEQGYVIAQFALGSMYDIDDHVPSNAAETAAQYERATEAVKWYRRAAQQGYALAQYNLGMLYQDGIGVPRDDEVALMWFEIAAAQGDTAAMDQRSTIAERMPREQIDSAQRRAAAFRPRPELP